MSSEAKKYIIVSTILFLAALAILQSFELPWWVFIIYFIASGLLLDAVARLLGIRFRR
jgi:hypothetical protein